MDIRYTAELANAIYDILADVCEAPDRNNSWSERDSFVRWLSDNPTLAPEWRFCGNLGSATAPRQVTQLCGVAEAMGGKFWPRRRPAVMVDCYSEDRNDERLAVISEATRRLEALLKQHGYEFDEFGDLVRWPADLDTGATP